ncbi:penicillin acylase family protein [Litorimonas haliclonae]|uniref:penicillin acylase family protein n=1 Tax=Litorimonas haliclonae TaxID=2081977 RepID=UPI0039F039FC
MFRVWAVVSVFLLASCATLETRTADPTEMARLEAQAQNVEIIRDDYGVPHIYGKTDADAVFGLLYAQAEDDFPRIERNYVWAMGRLAEIEGEEAIYSDLRARLYMTMDEAKAAYENAPADVKALCDAFADGLNYYLATHPEVEPELLTRFEPWMPMFFSEGSIGGDIEQIPLAGIKAFYQDKEPGDALLLTSNAPFEDPEPAGSNGIAVSGDLTRSGNPMLLINPHTSFYFRGEVHVVSEEGLNAYGAVTWGQFFVYQGFSEKNGWMHTSTYVDFIDKFREDISEQAGKMVYRYGDEMRPVQVSEVTLDYKDGKRLKSRTFPMYHTHHGPVTHMEGDKWVATKINWDPVNALKQSFLRTKTNGHAEFNEMMDIRTNSSNNTVYADAQGNIAYYHGNFIPKRDPMIDYSGTVNGWDTRTDWDGTHPVEEAITLLNPPNGWIQNANSTPFTAAGDNSPKREDYPAYMAPDKENFRAVHAIRLLDEADDLTLNGLIDLAYDPALPAFEFIIPSLVDSYELTNKDPSYAEAIAVLDGWDHTVSADSVAMSLAHFYGMEMLQSDARPKGASRMETYMHFFERGTPQEQMALLDKAMGKMTADYGTWKTPWGEINRFQRLSGDIDLEFDDAQKSYPVPLASGRWGALAAYGASQGENTKKIYGYRGNSFVAVVEFGEKVQAKSLLAGGQSNDPDSPHFDDQIEPYINVEFKDVPYYRDDVEARAVRTYRPGE